MDREKALNKLEKSQRDQMRLVAEVDSIRKEKNMLQKKLDHSDVVCVCCLASTIMLCLYSLFTHVFITN